ncbi:hypothetical protein LTR10_013242 [Elasticomyces elasticus]|uniref:DUF1680 domain protein n=1 Tax=Exophiala sideris TaxID=1016849 RepID=A0ABR0JB85_9EURO|nr:hypothetical protein LTR10_013242 [Elasticomyces elasticus]KAK5030621.1 hypothetical protein LTS07_005405 [Exophiala sideris]KAK5038675.1 hypothetical protein LTR13_004422 [Exophiala sideris]KAK5060556.1 hypothetical protein LTR69_005873 [Exophiala sideris]KAK5183468.1 hypothetical protein LTR44_004469 [Eurotiomycetes sp. CCFEE 6388]
MGSIASENEQEWRGAGLNSAKVQPGGARIDDAFWNPRIKTNQQVTIPIMYKQLRESPRWDSLKHTWKHGDPEVLRPHMDYDSDMAKFVEAVCYALKWILETDSQHATFLSWVDEAIDMIEAGQGPDGYFNTYYTVVAPEARWTNVAHNIELYDAGHLLEAAITHYQVTKSTRFLDIMTRYIDYICTIFGPEPGKIHGYPGHQEIELALFRLYDVRPEQRYFDLADYFIEQRGYGGGEFFDTEARARGDDPETWIPPPPPGVTIPYFTGPRAYWYMQADEQIRETRKVRGHSVRVTYYLSAVQDLATLNGDKSLDAAVDRLFDNIVDCHMYIHGGIGAIHHWEGFGENYELPLDGYAETCASIGILFLGKRMLQRRLSRKIALAMERALYNDVLGGVSLDGTSFFYDQPLSTNCSKRHTWFEVCCCPPNLSRFLNSLEDYVFTVSDRTIALNLYIGAEYASSDGDLRLKVVTKYPWEGYAEVSIQSEHREVGFAIREPEHPYKLAASVEGSVTDGYIHFAARRWNETITLSFDLVPKLVRSHPLVKSTQGLVAVERGPLVYCLESMDTAQSLDAVVMDPRAAFKEEKMQIADVEVVGLQARDFRLVPYFACSNRRPGEGLRVWMNCVENLN